MNKAKIILSILMPFWLLFMSSVCHGRYAAILIDADNGSVLHEVDAAQSWYPASLTKVMTLYMAFEALDAGYLHLYDKLTASNHVSRQPNSKLGLRTGESLTVEEAILAVITRSANDAAVALAEHLGGSEDNFAIKMTAKARALGMYNTRFMNATGLPNDWQVTTSRDMATLALKIKRNFPKYYPYFSSHSFYYKGRELRGINKFTAKYPGAEGMKTGFTCGSGFNLIGAAQQNGRNLIGVVLGGTTSAERYRLMSVMMDNGFDGTYSANSGRNINTLTAGFSGGEPPYQLSCGNGARGHAASPANRAIYSRHHGKLRMAKGKHFGKRTVLAKHRGGGHRIKLAASHKVPGKYRHAASSKKTLASAKKIAHRSAGKHLTTAKSGKRKGYHRPTHTALAGN